jgi:transposase
MIAEALEYLKVERVDDIPLLVANLRKMAVVEMLDTRFPAHGNWTGQLTFGEVVLVWLAFAISEGDHCLNHVEPWAGDRLFLLGNLLGKEVRALDFSDDRLAALLEATADEDRWSAFQIEFNRGIIRVYNLKYDRYGIRVDTTSSYTFASSEEPDGLFKKGHSKDHRPDLNQIKVCLATLDPLGLPLVCCAVPGNCADDPLYIPTIQEVQASLPPDGNTYFLDCKLKVR